jgi:hypothetical protein
MKALARDRDARYGSAIEFARDFAAAKLFPGGSFQSDKDHVTTTTRNLDLPTTRSPVISFHAGKSP